VAHSHREGYPLVGLTKDGSLGVDEALKRREKSLVQVEESEKYEDGNNGREIVRYLLTD